MKSYQVEANGTVFGIYLADNTQGARDACAQEAGYKDELDMVVQLEQLNNDFVVTEI